MDIDVENSAKIALVKAVEHFRLSQGAQFPGAENFMEQLGDEGFFNMPGASSAAMSP